MKKLQAAEVRGALLEERGVPPRRREPGICEGEPLLETLKGMFDLVGNTVSDFAPLL